MWRASSSGTRNRDGRSRGYSIEIDYTALSGVEGEVADCWTCSGAEALCDVGTPMWASVRETWAVFLDGSHHRDRNFVLEIFGPAAK